MVFLLDAWREEMGRRDEGAKDFGFRISECRIGKWARDGGRGISYLG